MKRAYLGWMGLGVAVLGVAYSLLDPMEVWMPKCPFHWLTGWECPACGLQRALHSLLRGEILAAWSYNPFLILSVPYFLAVVFTTYDPSRCAQKLRRVVQHRRVIMAYFWAVVAWWILRNLI